MNDYANIEFWYHFDYCQWQQHSKQTDQEYYNGWLMWTSFRFQLTFPQICRFHPHSKWQQKKIGKSLTWKYVCIQIYTNGWIIEGIKTRNWMLVKGALWSEEICKRVYDSTIFTYSPLLWKGFTKVKWHPFEHDVYIILTLESGGSRFLRRLILFTFRTVSFCSESASENVWPAEFGKST